MKTQVYDWPTRLFHWLFASGFIAAFAIAKLTDDESPVFSFHMLAGLFLGWIVTLRVIWGLIGTRYARFSSFALSPGRLIQYFKDVLTGKAPSALGHNPASSWAAIVMMALAIGLAATGLAMSGVFSFGLEKDAFEDIHELMANAFLVVALVHVTGVVLHSLRHKDWIGGAMIHGRKTAVEGQAAISSSRPAMGLLFLAVAGVFGYSLIQAYDAGTGTLNAFGRTIQLGESEGAEGGAEKAEGDREKGEAEGDSDHDDD